MPAPFVGILLRALAGSAGKAALSGGARATAAQAGKKTAGKAGQALLTKPQAPPVVPASPAAQKPVMKNIFQSMTQKIIGGRQAATAAKPDIISPGGQRIDPNAVAGQKKQESPLRGFTEKMKGMFSKPSAEKRESARAAKPESTFKNLLSAFNRNRGAEPTGDTENRTRTPADAKKPDIDFSKLMGMMGTPRATLALQESTQRQRDQEEEAARQKEEEGRPTLLRKFGAGLLKVTGILGKATFVVGSLLFAIKKWTDHLVESSRSLVIYNGAIATSVARLDIQKFQQGIQFAGRTEVSTIELNDAIMEFRESILPISEDVRSVANWVFKWGIKLTSLIAEIAKYTPYLMLLEKIADEVEEANEEDLVQKKAIGINKLMKSLELGAKVGQQGGPPPLKPII